MLLFKVTFTGYMTVVGDIVTASTGPLTFRCRIVSLTTRPACNAFYINCLMHLVDAHIQNDLKLVSREVQYLAY